MHNFFAALALTILPFTSSAAEWRLQTFTYDTKTPLVPKVTVRAGYLEAVVTETRPFQGSILYLQGLGDSMMNHGPLFQALSQNGYRIIAFDYMGQGGSGGTMNHTRIVDSLLPELEIRRLAELVWNRYAWKGKPKKIVMGWSTGGLAAYEMAWREWAESVILLAPGICARKSIGEGLLKGNKISLRTLTSASKTYATLPNPHVDPIRPTSPLKVPLFAVNVLATSETSKNWNISDKVSGLVLLSGSADSYVDTDCNRTVIKKNAPHFQIAEFPKALHEIDNEVADIQSRAFQTIVDFLGPPQK